MIIHLCEGTTTAFCSTNKRPVCEPVILMKVVLRRSVSEDLWFKISFNQSKAQEVELGLMHYRAK